jgi:hypothetical protein
LGILCTGIRFIEEQYIKVINVDHLE